MDFVHHKRGTMIETISGSTVSGGKFCNMNVPPDQTKPSWTFLHDRHSVDFQFVFSFDETCHNVGLWAHRSVLSCYKRLDDLIDGSLEKQVAQHGYIGPLTIKVDKFSLVSFACLAYYIYTGTAQRTIDTTQFALSQQNETVVVIKDRSSGRIQGLYALGLSGRQPVVETEGGDLGRLSFSFLSTLVSTTCATSVLTRFDRVDQSNAVELLFEVGLYFQQGQGGGVELSYRQYGVEV
ncbi:hypothetical protein BGX23_006916 [Mortierella sp. AD031]|nr:hypothetical protein BGX23_006916 [Mortierella sp. AD031]KAG0207891.1 hypothetical protein BGX33_006556 [Mortierella sp. NVP41]